MGPSIDESRSQIGPRGVKGRLILWCWGVWSKVNLFVFSSNIMLRFSFSPGHDRAFRHCWISSFWTPSGKQRKLFSRGPLFKPPGRVLFYFLHTNHRNSSNFVFLLICLPPWQETFADARDGDGGGPFGSISISFWDHFEITLGSFWDRLGSVLGPPIPTN